MEYGQKPTAGGANKSSHLRHHAPRIPIAVFAPKGNPNESSMSVQRCSLSPRRSPQPAARNLRRRIPSAHRGTGHKLQWPHLWQEQLCLASERAAQGRRQLTRQHRPLAAAEAPRQTASAPAAPDLRERRSTTPTAQWDTNKRPRIPKPPLRASGSLHSRQAAADESKTMNQPEPMATPTSGVAPGVHQQRSGPGKCRRGSRVRGFAAVG